MDLKTSLDKLYSLHQFGIKLGLGNITNFLERLGNPHDKFRSFHVAGSNGKGSTVSFIASMLMEKGYSTGLYTSPHFVRFNERVRVGKEEITDEYIRDFLNSNWKYIEDESLTFFEVTTGMAFKYFEELKVEYAAIETGLGGRLDATNVITPLASLITTISKEHMDILGNTLAKIAFEKAGIIKENSKVFAGILPAEAEEVVSKKADEMKSTGYFLKDFIVEEEESLKLKLLTKEYNLYSTPLRGKHQLYNAALAVKTFSTVMQEEDQIIINNGIMNVIENTGIQGRFEIYSSKPMIIFDSSHNPDGIKTFLSEYKKIYRQFNNRILVFTALRDKAVYEMLTMLAPYFNEFYITTVKENDRALPIEEILELCKKSGVKGNALQEPAGLIKEFKKTGNEGCLVVLGSMYMLGELKEKIAKNA
jgi:dihydrofolate synthase/folylpolyglutamate synthase